VSDRTAELKPLPHGRHGLRRSPQSPRRRASSWSRCTRREARRSPGGASWWKAWSTGSRGTWASAREERFALEAHFAAVVQLVTARLATGDAEEVRELHGPLVALGERMLLARAW